MQHIANVQFLNTVFSLRLLSLLGSCFFVLSSCAIHVSPLSGPNSHTIAPVLKRVMPATVNIFAQGDTPSCDSPLMNHPYFQQFMDNPEAGNNNENCPSSLLGSGVIIDAKKGYVVTNYHNIEDANEILVTLNDQRQMLGKVVGIDPESDLAVLQIKADRLTALPISTSHHVNVGDFIIAIGSPFGLGQTVTYGIVSAKGRTGLGIEGYEDFIQIDAPISFGNSGGALVNMKGQLIGVNTAIISTIGESTGVGFAISGTLAKSVTDQLIKYGKMNRGQVGVVLNNLPAAAAEEYGLPGGAVIMKVLEGSAGNKAGLQPADIITHLNGQPILSASSLHHALGLMQKGAFVNLTIHRGGKTLNKRIQLEPRQPLSNNLE